MLDMWRIVEEGIKHLTSDELKILKDTIKGSTEFIGFDGNNEDEYHIAHTLVNDMGRFECFAGRALNSHMQVAPGYRRMLEAFEPIRPDLADRGMTLEEIIAVLRPKRPSSE